MRRLGAWLACALLAAAPARAAEAARPKVALVLSGGGARGAAHVGVLKVLERLRVPVDYIVGTSMGSVVGGLYATGLSPGDLERFFTTFNWNGAFSDRPPRDGMSFRRKDDDFQFLVGYGVGMRGLKVRLPLGISQGQVFIGEIRTLGHLTQAYPSFDGLPIPYRCLATDLLTAEEVVISSGDLALAMRASASIAPLFSPVWYQGRFLADGGYLNNIPVDVARKLGADVVIAVDIGTPLLKEAEIGSLIDVFGQTSRLGGAEFDRRQLAGLTKKDILIRPDLRTMTIVDFPSIPKSIVWGEEAASSETARLERLSLSPEAYEAYKRGLKKRPVAPEIVDRIEIRNGATISDRVVRRMIRQEEGQPLRLRELQEDLLRVEGLGYFDYVDYHLEKREDGNTLVISAPRLFWGPGNLRFGIDLDEDFRSVSRYSLGMQYTRMDMNAWGGEARLRGHIGTDSDVGIELFQPIFRQPHFFHVWAPVFVNPVVGYESRLVDVAVPGQGAKRYRLLDPLVGVNLGYFVSNIAELRAGVERRWNDAHLQFGEVAPGNSSLYWNESDVVARVTVDTLDRVSFPHRGGYLKAEWRDGMAALGSGRPNESVAAGGAAFRSWGRHTLGFKGLYDTNLDLESPTPRIFTLGGLLRLSGFPEDSLFGTNAILNQLRYYWRWTELGGMPLYLGSAVEWGGVWNSRRQVSYGSGYWAGTGFLGVDTPLGPLFIASSLASGNRFSETFFLGHSF